MQDKQDFTLKTVPITIITGFLGSGKTTIINKILSDHKTKDGKSDINFALIINEFGEVGIDGEVTNASQEAVFEMSDGCLCCVVRSDLIGAVENIIENNLVDRIIIETSGLAEPEPIANTFLMDNLNGRIKLESVVCIVDTQNFDSNIKDYKILKKQLESADVVVLNKMEDNSSEFNKNLRKLVLSNNMNVSIIENTNSFDTRVLLDGLGLENLEKLASAHRECEENCSNPDHHHEHDGHHHHHDHHGQHNHHHDHHEHEDFSEITYSTDKLLDPRLLDTIFLAGLPKEIIRAKGFLRIKPKPGDDQDIKLFQMVGARKELTKYDLKEGSKIDSNKSFIVLIGKGIKEKEVDIINLIKACEI